MIGFYLGIENALEDTAIQLLVESFESFTARSRLPNNGLVIFDDKKTLSLFSKGYTFFVVGTLIYKNKWHADALKLVSNDLSSGSDMDEIAFNAKGQYCLVIHSKYNVFIITDKLGSVPIYRYDNNNSVQISNVFPLLSERNTVSFNFQALAEFISITDAYCLEETFFQEIRRLEGGTVYKFGNNSSACQYYRLFDNISFQKHTNLKKVSNIVEETLTENLSFLRSNDSIFVDITGGFDTRLVVALLNRIGVEFTGGICGDQAIGETEIAKDVARRINVDFRDDFRISTSVRFKETVDQHYMISNGIPQLYHSTELINYYDSISRNYNIHLTGFEGTELTYLTVAQSASIEDNLNIRKYITNRYKYTNVIDDMHIVEDVYYGNIEKKIAKIVENIKTDDPRDLIVPLTFLTYSKYYHGSMIGTHNCYLPQYSPYFEANYAKLMMESAFFLKYDREIHRHILSKLNPNLAKLITTSGFTAEKNSDFSTSLKRFSKRLAQKIIFKSEILERIARYLKNQKEKRRSDYSASGRKFWEREVEKQFSYNMPIFDIVNRGKVRRVLQNISGKRRFMAKIVYLNNIFEKHRSMTGH